jgi:hypothetical protein
VSLLEDVEAAMRARGPKCAIHFLLAELDEDDATDLRAAFDNPRFPATAISDALKKHGHPVTAGTINRHRKRACLCPA